MKILFTTNDHYYSKISNIVWREPLSHIVLNFSFRYLSFTLEISKYGGKITELSYFLGKNKAIHALEIELTDDEELEWFEQVLYFALGKTYHWTAYIYFGLNGIANWLLGIPVIDENIFQSDSKKLCSHILEPLEYELSTKRIFLPGDLGAKTPYMIYKHLYGYPNIKKIL